MVPIDGTSPGDGGLVYQDGVLGSVDVDGTAWMDFDVKAVVDASNVTVVVEDSNGFGVVYPFDAASSELSTGSNIHEGEKDYARVRFSSDGMDAGTYKVVFAVSYYVGGDLRTDRVVRLIEVGEEVIVTTTTTEAPTTTTTEAPTTTTTEATTTTTEKETKPLFEGEKGDWTFDPYGTDTATTGKFEFGIPELDTWSGVINQPEGTPSGRPGLVTMAKSSEGSGLYDVDGGETSALSRVITIPKETSATLYMAYYFSYLNNSSEDDFLRISIVTEDGKPETLVNVRGEARHVSAVWTDFKVDLTPYAGQDIQILVQAADNGKGSLVEAAVAEFAITE